MAELPRHYKPSRNRRFCCADSRARRNSPATGLPLHHHQERHAAFTTARRQHVQHRAVSPAPTLLCPGALTRAHSARCTGNVSLSPATGAARFKRKPCSLHSDTAFRRAIDARITARLPKAAWTVQVIAVAAAMSQNTTDFARATRPAGMPGSASRSLLNIGPLSPPMASHNRQRARSSAG